MVRGRGVCVYIYIYCVVCVYVCVLICHTEASFAAAARSGE